MNRMDFIARISPGAVFVLALILASEAFAYKVKMPSGPVPQSQQQAQQHWQAVLKKFVNEQGQVNFKGLKATPRDLDAYVSWIAHFSPSSNPQLFNSREKILAYYLNSYNALAMYNVLADGFPDSLGGLTKIDFFYFRELQIGGRWISLYDYENDVIRPLGEERVHFALNCMAAGCPHLPQKPFTAKNLTSRLEYEAKYFFSSNANLTVDRVTKTVHLSEILDFYTADFLAKAPTLIAYINLYMEAKIPADYQIEFIPYDWRVNYQN